MISVICGTIEEKSADALVVMTAGGIGFLVSVPTSLMARVGRKGDEVRLFTHLYVREDAVQLLGFEAPAQREMFLKLIAIPGVGPKAALSVLSSLSMQEFAVALATGDAKMITRAQGVGRKLAERILLELRGQAGALSLAGDGLAPASPDALSGPAAREAAQGLMALGYTAAEAAQAVARADAPDAKVEDIILKALKTLD